MMERHRMRRFVSNTTLTQAPEHEPKLLNSKRAPTRWMLFSGYPTQAYRCVEFGKGMSSNKLL